MGGGGFRLPQQRRLGGPEAAVDLLAAPAKAVVSNIPPLLRWRNPSEELPPMFDLTPSARGGEGCGRAERAAAWWRHDRA